MKVSNPKHSPAYSIEIEENALNFYREYALIAFIAIVSALWVIAIILFIELKSALPIYWIICVTILESFSFFLRRLLPNTQLPRSKKLKIAALLNFFDGCVIGSCIIFMPYISDIIRTVLIFAMITSCIGATTTTLGYQLFFLCFSAPISVSFLSSSILSIQLWGGSNSLYAVLIISLAISLFIYNVSKDIYRNYQDAFNINLKNREMNEELEEAVSAAKNANKSKTRFLAAASHDLRQPIHTLSLFIAALSLKSLNTEDQQIISHMTSAVNTIDTQLNSFVEMSKLDTGIVVPKNTDIDIVPILRDMISLYKDQQNSDDLSFKFSSTVTAALINTDQMLFERVMQNIIGNSIKYTESGSINVFLEKSDEENLSITIDDTGVGISKENLLKIYDEFYQVGNLERDSKHGFGLGLSIVKKLCELLNFNIEIKSDLGKGTSVQLKVPYISHANTDI